MLEVERDRFDRPARPFDDDWLAGADAPLFNHRRIGAAGRRLEDVTEFAPQRFGGRRVDMDSETSPHRHVDRPEIVDAMRMVGVLVGDQHGVEMGHVRAEQLLA